MSLKRLVPALVFATLSSAAFTAFAAEPASLNHKDWELQCDNTRTCRAAGYQAEEGDSEPVSMLITREAGPDTLPSVQLQVQSEQEVTGALQLQVGKLVLRGLEGDVANIAARDVPELIRALLDADSASVRAGKKVWTLSLAGVKAVLLKMDEAQGRLDTPGALVRRGRKPERSVLPALPPPTIVAVIPPENRKGDADIGARAVRNLPKAAREEIQEECNDKEHILEDLSVQRLDEQRLLVSAGCPEGAYNYSTINWIVSTKPPHTPQRIDPDGELDASTGLMSSVMKGRGIADCIASTEWQFDGKQFVQSGVSADGMCRGFPGGAWQLPSFVSRVVRPAKAKR